MFFKVVSLVPFRGGADQWLLGPMVQRHQCVVSMWCLWWPVTFLEMYIVLLLSTCCAFTHLILIIIWKSVMFIAFVYACVFENINKLDSGTRVHRNTWRRVSQAWKGITKEMKRFRTLILFGVLAWTPAHAQTNTGSSDTHAQWFSHWKIRADDHDFIMWHHEDLSYY